ncbi:MAG: D-isomer specific 2-hydroxyacid dehydrogenase, catalytic domain protein [Haloquadratum sp. J07HQX50]|nr:MAG: D-isomer specific 2-hydroxyacid dehydrogenase, catalytic domain protein [Haloquadratum sp. J07HQX50]
MPHKIAVSQADMPDAIIEAGVFERAPLDVDLVTGAAENEAELIELARGADGLAVQYAEVTAAVLEELPNLSVVSRYGIGVDNIDIDAASEHGVAVTHVPSYCEEEVASHALGLLLSVARNTAQYDRQVRSGHVGLETGAVDRSVNRANCWLRCVRKDPTNICETRRGI